MNDLTPTGQDGRIFAGLGANLPMQPGMPPRAALGAALAMLEQAGVRVARRSRWYESLPVPYDPAQPNYVNGAVEIETRLPPRDLMTLFLNVEAALGRVRTVPNAPRTVDLDLLVYGSAVHTPEYPGDIVLPHPRMLDRAFVMVPLAEIAPDWRHPETGVLAGEAAVRLNIGGLTEMRDGGGLFGAEWGAPGD
ncbi:MAG: 2-amino-4-hydroxy-6-hydroxymethyldihydropteridine diphosphokinase [Rhodospirillales bacterium]